MIELGIQIVPITIKAANRYVAKWHRHNRPVHGALFAAAAAIDGEIVGVAIVGRPISRHCDDGATCEITRLVTDGTYNACSKLYGACCRAAQALGYEEMLTKTLRSEPGSSLKASGFVEVGETPAGATWDRPSRRRIEFDLFGEQLIPSEGKRRWRRILINRPADRITKRSES